MEQGLSNLELSGEAEKEKIFSDEYKRIWFSHIKLLIFEHFGWGQTNKTAQLYGEYMVDDICGLIAR